MHTTIGRWNGLTDHDIEKLIYLRKEDFDYKEWVALKYARDWTLARGLEEPTGNYIDDYNKFYTDKERKAIRRMLQTMRWANYTSHTVLKGDSGKWRLDLQGQKLFPPFENSSFIVSDYENNDCPCVCLKPFPVKIETDENSSISTLKYSSENKMTGPLVNETDDSYKNHLKHYTACNLWYTTPYTMWSINFKEGTMIPAGTEVTNIHIDKGRCTFSTMPDGKRFGIKFCYPWHPGFITHDYKKKLFTTNTFEQLTKDMGEPEIEAIKAGHIIKGMRKKAVLIAFGYPPEFANTDLNAEKWAYWKDKDTPIQICFDKDGKAIACSE